MFIFLAITIIVCIKLGCFFVILWDGSIVKKAVDKLCDYKNKKEAKYETGTTPKGINRC